MFMVTTQALISLNNLLLSAMALRAPFIAAQHASKLITLMAHCERGDEYICGQQAHNYKFEGGGAA